MAAPKACVSGALDEGGLEWYLNKSRPVPTMAMVGNMEAHSRICELMQQQQYPGVAFSLSQVDSIEKLRKKKDRRNYDGYIPTGILKADWCRKHQQDVFGCIMLLLDIDAASGREAFESTAEATVERLKQQLKGRQTKILIIVTTNAERLPLYDKAETCQSSLKKKCDLEAIKNVALLHLSRGTIEGAKRVLQITIDFSLQYYKDEAKKVKKLKETVHRTLQPRHRFKVAYYFEIRGQTDLALRYYGQCYDHIRGLSPDQFSMTEIKTVAEIVIQRTCALRLLHDEGNKVTTAVKLFKDHMSWYRDAEQAFAKPTGKHKSSISGDSVSLTSPLRRYGSPSVTSGDREREAVSQSSGGYGAVGGDSGSVLALPSAVLLHHVAVARQHEHFAGMLAEAGITADTEYGTMGYHYHASATAVLQRRAYVKYLLSTDHGGTSGAPPVRPLYVGQPWGGSEDMFLSKLLEREEEVPYEEEAIVLCIRAKKATPESRQLVHHNLSMVIARCHVDLERWEQAREELEGVYEYLQKSQWPGLSEIVLKLLMECGMKREALREYLDAAVRYMVLPGVKTSLYSVIVDWLKGGGADSSLGRALTRPDTPPVVSVDMSHPFMSVMVQFAKPTVQVHNETFIRIRAATKAVFPIRINSVEVRFHQDHLCFTHHLEEEATVTAGHPCILDIPITFKEACVVKMKEIVLHVEDGVLSLSREIGQCSELINRLVTEALGSSYPDYTETRFPDEGYGLMGSSFVDRPAVKVMKSVPKMVVTLHHDPPALLNEPYPVEILVAAGDDEVSTGSITIRGSQDFTILDAYREDDEEVICTEEVSSGGLFDGENSASVVNKKYQVGNIPMGGVWKLTAVMKFKTCGKHPLPVDTQYSTEKSQEDLEILKRLEVSVEIPFNISAQVADSMRWRQGDLATPIPNPHCTASYSLQCNTMNEVANSSFNSTTKAGKQQADDLTKLGVVAPCTPYSIRTKRATAMSSMRLNQTATLTVTLTCTVEKYGIEVTAVQPIPTKGMKILSEQPFDAVVLSCGEEVTVTWLIEPTELPNMRCNVVVMARREGSGYACIPFTVDVPPFAVVLPEIVTEYTIPGAGQIGEVLPLTVRMRNTSQDTTRHVTCEATDQTTDMEHRFLWSGRSSWSANIPPKSIATFTYQLVPVFPGVLQLPSMSVKLGDKRIIEPHETASIFISPQNSAFRTS
eukprot:TRINITY_DN9782_c0_g1_i1.p1 TRINITY_DN9782_c0_g1~~TRINITY_DN9782_c0_g1_i1.p1  ORF type:complete len:1197 (+),score=301.45 TRINITY_DN9782_c0_g1_i1:53-3643(+)